MVAVAGPQADSGVERLAVTVAEARALLQADDAGFAAQLRATIARVGAAAGVSTVAFFRVRRLRSRGPRWRSVASWTAPGLAARVVPPGGRWAPVTDATRVDAATIGAPGRRRPVTLVTEVGRRRGELRVCVFLVIDGRRDTALVFVGPDGRVPTTPERLAFAEAGRVLGGALHEYLRVRRERRRRTRQREIEQLRRRVVQLEGRVADALALQRGAEEHATELSRANEAMSAAIARLVQADDLLRFLSDMLCETLRVAGAQGGAIVVLGPQGADHVVLRARDGFLSADERARRGVATMPYDEFTNALITRLARGETVSIHDVDGREGAFPDFHRAEGNRLVRLVPMRASSRLIGWIGLGFADRQPRGGTRDTMLHVLADQMTLAVELTRLAAEARDSALLRQAETAFEERTAELVRANRALGQSIARLTATGDLQSFLASILATAVTAAGATSGILYQREAGSRHYDPVAHLVNGELVELGSDDGHASYRRPISVDHPWVTAALCSDAVQMLDLANSDDRRPELDQFRRRGYRYMTFAPLRDRGQPVGFLGLGFGADGAGPPDGAKVELARLLAQQATLAARLAAVAAEWQKVAVARERDRLMRERLDELAFVNEAIGRSLVRLSDGDDLDAFLESVLQEVVIATGAAIGVVRLHDAARDLLYTRVVVVRGERVDLARDPRAAAFRDATASVGDPLWEAMRRGELWWTDARDAPALDEPGGHERSAVAARRSLDGAIPMLEGATPIGFIGVAYPSGGDPPSAARLELCRTLAQHAALAARLAQLTEQRRAADVERERARAAEAQAAELAIANAALSRSGARLIDLDHLDRYLASVVEELAIAAGAVTGSVYMHDPATDMLVARLVISRGRRIDIDGEAIAAPFREPIKATGHYMWEALRRQEVYWWDYAARDPRHRGRFDEWDAAQRHRFAAAVPMLHGDTPIGFLGLAFDAESPPPSPLRVELCRSLAQHAALATRLTALADQARDAAVLGERTRLARDMHDTVAQGLTAIVLQLQAAEGPVPVEQRDRFVRQAIDLARGGLLEARRAVYALRADRPDGADLGAALDSSLKLLFSSSATRIRVEIDGERRRLEPLVEDELLRIAQEVAVNALKHAHAAEFVARLRFSDAGVELRLADDGRGFDVDAKSEGFGVRGIRERAARLNARLLLRTAPGAGTEVAVTLPADAH